METAKPVLTVKGLKAYYQMAYFGIDREVRAVDDITLTIRENEVYGIAGESSSGKTSLIKTFAAAIRPPLRIVDGSMTFTFGDKVIDPYKASKAEVDAIRWKNLSYIMQGSMSLLNLATVCRPNFIIADEPTTALDVVVQKDVLAMIHNVQREMGSSVVFVTHDMGVHANIADRIGIIYAGRLVEEGPTRRLFEAPRHPYTAHLVGSLPRIGDSAPRVSLEGRPPNLADPPQGCRFHPRCPMAIEKCKKQTPPLETVGADHRSACWRSDEVGPPDSLAIRQSEGAA